MGRIFYPLRGNRRKPVSKLYLGYGYWLVSFDDGTEELRFFWDRRTPFISDAKEFSEEGFPVWDEKATMTLKVE